MHDEIILGDCLDSFKTVEDNSIDVVFADPPFNLDKKYKNHKDTMASEDYMAWCEKWIKEIIRVTKPDGSIFIHNIPRWLLRYAPILNEQCVFKHWIAWDAPTSPMGKSLQPGHYGILYYGKTDKPKFHEIRHPHKRCRCRAKIKPDSDADLQKQETHRIEGEEQERLLKDYGGKKDTIHLFGPLVSDVWTDIHRVKHNKYRSKHPCQLPIHLLERIILMSTDQGDVVLDPFMGTGTTALAAKRLGRRYIGFEKSSEYRDDALLKLEQETTQSKVGPYWISYFPYAGLVTVRDKDCEGLFTEEYFDLPEKTEMLDRERIQLKKEYVKLLTGTPAKSKVTLITETASDGLDVL